MAILTMLVIVLASLAAAWALCVAVVLLALAVVAEETRRR
jgi:hypothetical protein